MEIWRSSPLCHEFIEVSNLGRARSLPRKTEGLRLGVSAPQNRPARNLSPCIGSQGYLQISVKAGAKRTKYLLHRLVASAFCEGFTPGLTVNHIDGNKLNNLPANLEWVLKADNTKHQWRTGLVDLRGEANPLHKLTNDDVIAVKMALDAGEKAPHIAKRFGVSASLIYKISQGRKRVLK